MLMVVGGIIMLVGIGVAILVSNSGRLSSNAGNDLTQSGFAVNKRSACITDLRNEADGHGREVQIATLRRLAVLDGFDPRTQKEIVAPSEEDREMVQAMLAKTYTVEGLQAAVRSVEATAKLKQPELNELCGEPITDKSKINN